MPKGFGRGGYGFGLRGWTPPWPYVGMGRGGLPRCWYFFSGAAGTPYGGYMPQWGYGAAPGMWSGYASQWGYAPSAPYPQAMGKEQELEFLKAQADAVKAQLDAIEARVRELEEK